jgi:uncharacterized protein YcfL
MAALEQSLPPQQQKLINIFWYQANGLQMDEKYAENLIRLSARFRAKVSVSLHKVVILVQNLTFWI